MLVSRKLLFAAIAVLVVIGLSIVAALFAYNFAHRKARADLYTNVATFQAAMQNYHDEFAFYPKTIEGLGYTPAGSRTQIYFQPNSIPPEFLSKISDQNHPRIESPRYQVIIIYQDSFPKLTSVWVLKSDFEMPIFLFEQ